MSYDEMGLPFASWVMEWLPVLMQYPCLSFFSIDFGFPFEGIISNTGPEFAHAGFGLVLVWEFRVQGILSSVHATGY